MTEADAQEIAALINRRNQLSRDYTAHDVILRAECYDYELRSNHVAACVERKRVQWYQWEILHLSVAEEWEGKGLAFAVYARAEQAARSQGARVLQCTIRLGNSESETFFRRQGFRRVGEFWNHSTANDVGLWQKILSPTQGAGAPGGDGLT